MFMHSNIDRLMKALLGWITMQKAAQTFYAKKAASLLLSLYLSSLQLVSRQNTASWRWTKLT